MGSKGSAPAAPDYAALIPQQEAAYNRSFNRMLGASRVNSQTPYGSTTWIRPGTQTPLEQRLNNIIAGSREAAALPPGALDSRQMAMDVPPNTGTSAPPQYITQQQGDNETQVMNPEYLQWMQSGGGADPARTNPTGLDVGDFGDPWTMIQSLSPEQQQLYDQDIRIRGGMGNIAEGMMGNIADIYGTPANFAGQLPQFQNQSGQAWTGPDYRTNMNSRNDAEQAIFNRQMRYDLPLMDRRRNQAQDRLLAMGANVADERYGNAMGDLYDSENRYMADAVDRAILGGGQEATAELGRGLSAAQAGFGAGMQNRQFLAGQQNDALNYALSQIGQQRADRAMPMNEMNAFRTGNQVQLPGAPAQFSTPNLQSVDPMGAANMTYQGQLGQYNANQAASNNFMSGLFGLGGAALGSQGFWGLF